MTFMKCFVKITYIHTAVQFQLQRVETSGEDFPGGPVRLRLRAPNAGGPGSIPVVRELDPACHN